MARPEPRRPQVKIVGARGRDLKRPGILVPAEDPDASAGGLARIVADREMVARTSSTARLHLPARSSVDRMAEQTPGVSRGVLGPRAARGMHE